MTVPNTVHVRFNDAETNQPVPVRLSLRAQGQTHVPFGRTLAFSLEPGVAVGGHLRLAQQNFVYIDGGCEVRLPSGDITLEATRGPEYVPLMRTVTLAPGQISLRLSIERASNWRTRGWFAGDMRVLWLNPQAALLEARAEDLAIVNLLACELPVPGDPERVCHPNLLAFSGVRPVVEDVDHLIVVNTLNEHPVLGSLALHNCHRPVYPLRFGAPHSVDDWSLIDWCDQCHRKKTGLVVWSAPRDGTLPGGALAALLLGKVDAFEVSRFDEPEPTSLTGWYALLDAGLRTPLVAGSGKDSNAIALGAVRTYAQLAPSEPLNYPGWIEAIRAGRTFVTNGPLLSLEADSARPGSVLTARQEERIALRAETFSACKLDRVEILVNGEVVASREPSGDARTCVVETQWRANASAWIAARCWSQDRLLDGQVPFAHTSALHVEVADRRLRADPRALRLLAESLQSTRAWVETQSQCPTDKYRQQLLAPLHQANERLQRQIQSHG